MAESSGTTKGTLLVAILLLIGLCMGYQWYTSRNAQTAIVAESVQDYTPEGVVCYRQSDKRWKTDKLGDSSYTMGNSGCLTTCIASALQMQQISIDGLGDSPTPGELNQLFSTQNAYDSEGNLQWDVLASLTGAVVVQKDAEDLEENELDTILARGSYPIVRVRVGGTGSWHYVLIASSQDGEYWCMDPMATDGNLVPLSDFDEKIYAVRYLKKEVYCSTN